MKSRGCFNFKVQKYQSEFGLFEPPWEDCDFLDVPAQVWHIIAIRCHHGHTEGTCPYTVGGGKWNLYKWSLKKGGKKSNP